MKKMFSWLVAALVAAMLLPCISFAMGLINPITTYDRLDDVNAVVGCSLCRPPVMGVETVACMTIDCGDYIIGEYDFLLNGREYMLRAAQVDDRDISGIYDEQGTLFDNDVDDWLMQSNITSQWAAARWMTADGYQYVLSTEAPEENYAAVFNSLVDEMMNITEHNWDRLTMDDSKTSVYQDEWSQRAMATVIDKDDATVTVIVEWSSSAWEYSRWTMHASFQQLGDELRLVYDDCVCETIMTNDEGDVIVNTEYEQGAGWFTCQDNNSRLLWDGAENEWCRECVFVNMPE